jgi:hypothetical protein
MEEEEEEQDPMMLSLEDIPELDLEDDFKSLEEEDNNLDDSMAETDLEIMIRHVLFSKRDTYLQVMMSLIRELSSFFRPLSARFFNFMTGDELALKNIEKDVIQVTIYLRRVFASKKLHLFEFKYPVKDPMLVFTKMLLSRFNTFINLEDDVYDMVTSRNTASQYRFGDDKSFGTSYVQQERYYEYEGFFLLAMLSKDVYSCGYCFDKLKNLYHQELLDRVLPVVLEVIQPSSFSTTKKKKKRKTSDPS